MERFLGLTSKVVWPVDKVAVNVVEFEFRQRPTKRCFRVRIFSVPDLRYDKQIFPNDSTLADCTLYCFTNELFVLIFGSSVEQSVPTLNNCLLKYLCLFNWICPKTKDRHLHPIVQQICLCNL